MSIKELESHENREREKRKYQIALQCHAIILINDRLERRSVFLQVPPLSLLTSEDSVQGFSTCSRLLVGGELEHPKFFAPTVGAVCGNSYKKPYLRTHGFTHATMGAQAKNLNKFFFSSLCPIYNPRLFLYPPF
ncbi:hypothetical protein DVH24_026752 [Malus domestica]|uniref:Uncharacterized protein n=1 Tax=Malus domestica TaxID=3750 RepID=A0A498K9X1_MALDO|nr:hypothetical protein DVH24_026752 [Malus domestica]